jgi:hypothetical protein
MLSTDYLFTMRCCSKRSPRDRAWLGWAPLAPTLSKLTGTWHHKLPSGAAASAGAREQLAPRPPLTRARPWKPKALGAKSPQVTNRTRALLGYMLEMKSG